MDARQYAPATERNRQPILEVLTRVLPTTGNILEIASGTGEHAVFFASHLPSCRWIPSDLSRLSRESITAWKNANAVTNLDEPMNIDVTQSSWIAEAKKKEIDAIVNINMIHISPWQACLGLMAGASQILSTGGIIYLYGPYKRNGEHTSPSNDSFDHSLRDRNSEWGVRDLEKVIEVAAAENFKLQEVIEMPANNLSVIWHKP
jgi:cyclopropane fatty-acyl-phospholipid synthase-like methyltransferase